MFSLLKYRILLLKIGISNLTLINDKDNKKIASNKQNIIGINQ